MAGSKDPDLVPLQRGGCVNCDRDRTVCCDGIHIAQRVDVGDK